MTNSPRFPILKPLGVITQPNEFGTYAPGALKRARNCVLRDPHILSAAPSTFTSTVFGFTGGTLYKMFALDAGHVYTWSRNNTGTSWRVDENGNAAGLPSSFDSGDANAFSPTGRIFPVRARDRMLVSSRSGVLAGDYMAPSNSTERTLRYAGLQQPQMQGASVTAQTSGGAFPGGIVIGYTCIIKRTFSDGYTIVSVPALPCKVRTGATTSRYNGSVSIKLRNDMGYLPGDVIEVYRSNGIDGTTITVDPPNVMKKVASYTLTSADLTATAILKPITDASLMGDPPYYQTEGEELYCNAGQVAAEGSGAVLANRLPPLAAAMATYDGRVFYGNTTERPKLTLSVPAGIGTSTNVGQQTTYWLNNGIGARFMTGTITSGNATITGISATVLAAGVKVGQRWVGNTGTFPSTAFIIAVGATTVTMSTNALANDTIAFFGDVLEISVNGGTPQQYFHTGSVLSNFIGSLMQGTTGDSFATKFELTGDYYYATNVSGDYAPNWTFTIEPINFAVPAGTNQTLDVRATNGANYNPPLPELYSTYPSQPAAYQVTRTTFKTRLTWSKDQQGEHVPPGNNESFVGLRELVSMKSTTDALWIACLDGVFRLSGQAGQYRIDQIDSTKIICAPQCLDVLEEDAFMYTNYGMYKINNESRINITDQVIGDQLPGPEFADVATRIVVANEEDMEVLYRDDASADRVWVYATRSESPGWTTLENNTKPGPLSNITAISYQRSPASGSPRILFGVSPGGATQASYSGWGNTASYLTMDFLYQPLYFDDPVGMKHWQECSFIWQPDNAGKTFRPVWNDVPVGSSSVVLYQNAAYGRAGTPRDHRISQSIMIGADSVTASGAEPAFLGLSVVYKPITSQAKQRGT